MDERELRELIAAVKAKQVSRRAFVLKMVGLGLAAPFATQLLAHAGLAQTAPATEYKLTKAGGGGALKLLFWQAATLLNPHFAVGAKDAEGCRIFYEPLAAWDPDGNLVPVLAAEIPDVENGGVAADGDLQPVASREARVSEAIKAVDLARIARILDVLFGMYPLPGYLSPKVFETNGLSPNRFSKVF